MENRITEPAISKKVTKSLDLIIGQLVLIKNHWKGPFDPTYIYNHWISGIPNKSTVLLTRPDGKEKKCNIHHVKLVTSLDVTTLGHSSNVEHPTDAFQQFQDSIQQDTSNDVMFVAIPPTTCTTYDQRQRDHKYTFAYYKGKRLKSSYIKIQYKYYHVSLEEILTKSKFKNLTLVVLGLHW